MLSLSKLFGVNSKPKDTPKEEDEKHSNSNSDHKNDAPKEVTASPHDDTCPDLDDEYYEQDVVVNKQGDCRKPVYNSKMSKESIIKCIGELQMIYEYNDKNREYHLTKSGTGTVYHVDQHQNAFILTSAQNIRHRVKECSDCGKWMEVKNQTCVRWSCKGDDLHKIMTKATNIHFIRRNVENDYLFGHMDKRYTVKCWYINDLQYDYYPGTANGFNIAILRFHDTDDYYAKFSKDICVKNGQYIMETNVNSFSMFGYAADSKENVDDKKDADTKGMKGMSSTGSTYKVIKQKQTGEYYLKQKVIDASAGQSGACLFMNKAEIFGVHTGGSERKKYNVATLISNDILDKMQNEKGAMEKLKAFEGKINGFIKDLKMRGKHVNEEQKHCQKDINERFDALIEKINNKRTDMLNKLNDIAAEKRRRIDVELGKISGAKDITDKMRKEFDDLKMDKYERAKQITLVVDEKISNKVFADTVYVLPGFAFEFNKKSVSSFVYKLADVYGEETHPLPIIADIQCGDVTDTQCTVCWNATLREKDLNIKTKTKLFMQLICKNVNHGFTACELIEFDANNNKYSYNITGLKKATLYIYEIKMVLFVRIGIGNNINKRVERKDISHAEILFNFETLSYDYYQQEFIYESDYDTNGICYLLGTNFGRNNKWMNPAENGVITLKTSGWSYGGINETFLGRKKCQSCSANIKDGFVSIDFGANLKIKVNAYTLRHNNGYNGFYLRSWNLLGSNDGMRWIVIKQHENDKIFNKPGQSHTFKIEKCEKYYRYFKIQITGENSGGYWNIFTTGFEIYGCLTGNE